MSLGAHVYGHSSGIAAFGTVVVARAGTALVAGPDDLQEIHTQVPNAMFGLNQMLMINVGAFSSIMRRTNWPEGFHLELRGSPFPMARIMHTTLIKMYRMGRLLHNLEDTCMEWQIRKKKS